MLICMLGSVLLAPFIALISRQIRRSSPRLELLADVQLICGVIGIVIVLLFVLPMATIAFRPDMSPQVLRALNDSPGPRCCGRAGRRRSGQPAGCRRAWPLAWLRS